MRKTRYAMAGVSQRGMFMYAIPIQKEFGAYAELAGLWDVSQVHMDYCNKQLVTPVPTYKDFDRMLKEAEFDTLIVTTMDRYHHEYVIRGLKAGKDIIVEKPMTIDAEKCRAILAAEKKYGRKVTVTFNLRLTPMATAIRRCIQSGVIGDVVTVDLHWPLSLVHGADYFRRWHSRRENSGGLQVHKCTHHFDFINWCLGDEPESVSAQGGLAFYGRNGSFHGKRCAGCRHKDRCRFWWDMNTEPWHSGFYGDAEEETGYYRDGCVFDPAINIEDHYQAMVKYKKGALMSYSMQAWAPWEGFNLEIQGTKGRFEYLARYGNHEMSDRVARQIVVTLNDGSRMTQTPPRGVGGHGGGDFGLNRRLFLPKQPDPDGQMAGTRDACNSVLIGVGVTESIRRNGAWINIPKRLKGK